MKQLYDELDAQGNIIRSNILLVPGLSLPEGHSWVEHTITLEEAKASKKTEIEEARNNACFIPVSAIGYTWQVDTRSQTLLSSAILLAQIGATPVPPTWRSIDNVDVPVTLDDLKTIAGTIAYYTQAAYSKSWDLKNQIDTATTVEEVNNIKW